MLSRIILLFVLCSLELFAIEGAVSLSIVQKERHFISEELIVKVDLKSTAYSIIGTKIRLENSKDYIIERPKSAASLDTINTDDEAWQVVHYEYKLYPLHAGEIVIPKIDISFSASMGYGQPKKAFNLHSKPLAFSVEAPEGVDKNTFVLSTHYYNLKSVISLEMNEENATQIKVGDVITLSVTQKAKEVPDILLRPSEIKQNNYFTIYPEEPQLKSKKSFVIRKDTYTLVARKEGYVTIPAQSFVWWDTEKKLLHKEMSDSYSFEILPNPQLAVESIDENVEVGKKWLYLVVATLVLFLLIYKLYPWYKTWSRARKLSYENSEEGLYVKLLKSPDTTTLYRNFYLWLESINPELAKEGFRAIVAIQPSFKPTLKEFEAILAKQEQEFDKIGFINEVKKLRELLHLKLKQNNLIPTINP